MRFALGLCLAASLNVVGAAFVFGWPPFVLGLVFAGVLDLIPGAIFGEVCQIYQCTLARLALACVIQCLCTWCPTFLTFRMGPLTVFSSYAIGQILGIGLGVRALFPLRSGPGPNYCAKCGYCLRGLPEPRCPECGTPFGLPPSDQY